MTPAEIEAMVEHLQARTSRIEQILPTLATKDDLRAMRASVEPRFDAVDARFDAIDARFEAVDARFDAVDALIDAVARQMLVLHEDLKSDVRLLAEHLARVLERLEERR